MSFFSTEALLSTALASNSAFARMFSLFSIGSALKIVEAALKSSFRPVSAALSNLLATPSVPIVFDVSANSNQGIPFVLHARETTDLTNSLLAEINEGSEEE